MTDRTPCRIGVWGFFDSDAFGDAVIPHIYRRELRSRVSGAKILMASPLGSDRPTAHDGGEPVDPLGPYSAGHAADLVAGLDCLVVAGADLLPDHDRLAGAYGVDRAAIDSLDPGRLLVDVPTGTVPVVWQGVTVGSDPSPDDARRLRDAASGLAHVSASDAATRARLLESGLDQVIEIEPDVVVLTPRLFSPDLLAKRLDYLWLMGWYPPEGAAVVVEGDAALLGMVPTLGAALSEFLESEPDLKVVIAELGSPGDEQFAASLAATLAATLPPGSVYHLPRCAGLEDVATAIANCAIFAGGSRRAGLVAQAFGRTWLPLDPGASPTAEDFERARLAGAAPAPTGEPSPSSLADAELDRIAEIAVAATSARTTKEEPMPDTEQLDEVLVSFGHLQVAHEARSRRLATERMVFANHLHKAEAEIGRLKDETARLREELARADGRTLEAEARTHAEAAARHALEDELAGLRATRTFRYTAELRTVYGRLRRMGDSPSAESPENGAKRTP